MKTLVQLLVSCCFLTLTACGADATAPADSSTCEGFVEDNSKQNNEGDAQDDIGTTSGSDIINSDESQENPYEVFPEGAPAEYHNPAIYQDKENPLVFHMEFTINIWIPIFEFLQENMTPEDYQTCIDKTEEVLGENQAKWCFYACKNLPNYEVHTDFSQEIGVIGLPKGKTYTIESIRYRETAYNLNQHLDIFRFTIVSEDVQQGVMDLQPTQEDHAIKEFTELHLTQETTFRVEAFQDYEVSADVVPHGDRRGELIITFAEVD